MAKLSKERLEEIRARLQVATPDKEGQYLPIMGNYSLDHDGGGYEWESPADQEFVAYAPADVAALLAELDRIRPEWVPIAAGQHMSSRWYHVAGRTQPTAAPVWMGRGKYDETWERWIDANTLQPFSKGIELTHYLQELTPTELIGQPEAGQDAA